MEPMNLGSPVNSPGAIAGGGNNQSQYLPPFLMGDPQASMTPHNNTLSPKPSVTRGYNVAFVTSPGGGGPSSGQQTTQTDYNRSMNLSNRSLFGGVAGGGNASASMTTGGVGSGGHQTGPPTQGLFDSIRDASAGSTPHRNHLMGLQSQQLNQTSSQHNFSLNQSYQNDSFAPNAPNAINASMRALCSPLGANMSSIPTGSGGTPSIMQFKPQSADFWVTIYGYSPGASSMILQHFTVCGTIAEVQHAPQNGNWMHVRFSSRIESDKALNYNQKVIGGNVMVGVTRCTDKAILDKENCNANALNANLSEPSDTLSSPKVRPFAQQSYQMAKSSNTVSPTNKNAPQKSSGLVNKAMDMIFGW
ncbi:nucleoporin Nup35 [Drosophila tropicalis]|uniref:nucleoporin Nup35 n=1 Tax=Drosophila tropicalis TaxID=46794 RepID=UPI0035ABCFF8